MHVSSITNAPAVTRCFNGTQVIAASFVRTAQLSVPRCRPRPVLWDIHPLQGIRERMKSLPRHSAYCLGGTGVVISLRWNEYHHVRNTFCPTFGPSPVLHRRTCSLERRAPSSDCVPEARQQDSRPQSAAVLPSLPCHYIKDECARQHAMRLCRPGFSIKCP